MVAVSKLTKEYHYTSKMLKKNQVHIKFPHIIYNRKSFDNPYNLFVHYFRIKGTYEHKINTLKVIANFMDGLVAGKVDFNNPLSYFPLYVLESRWLMKYVDKKLTLNTRGKEWLEALKETIELYGDLNESERPS